MSLVIAESICDVSGRVADLNETILRIWEATGTSGSRVCDQNTEPATRTLNIFLFTFVADSGRKVLVLGLGP